MFNISRLNFYNKLQPIKPQELEPMRITDEKYLKAPVEGVG